MMTLALPALHATHAGIWLANREGEVQTSDRAHPAPDGASGWHERFITVFD